MKKFYLHLLVALLPMVALTTFTSCGDDDEKVVVNPSNLQNQGGDNNNQQSHEIIVTVDANGNADGGHRFSRIDETTFLIDGIIYKYEDGYLIVSSYEPSLITSNVEIISRLIYEGFRKRTMFVINIAQNVFKDCNNITSVNTGGSMIDISPSAFFGCVRLKSITLGCDVNNIEQSAFSGCTNLTDVSCYAIEPPTAFSISNNVNLYAFDLFYIKEHTTLHVPAGSVNAYKATEPWKSFKSIVAIE